LWVAPAFRPGSAEYSRCNQAIYGLTLGSRRGRQGDKETGRQGDKETRRLADKETGVKGL
ncbi:MAG: hypothetical protein J4G05_12520, partial [Chlorobi bacterium]|nr:hypothetical protein [Chlorobiota bacterium]